MNSDLDAIAHTVSALYPTGIVKACQRCDSGLINTTYHLKTNSGPYALTAFTHRSQEYVRVRSKVVLALRNLPIAPPLEARSGERIVIVNDRPAWLCQWLEGKSPVDQTHHLKHSLSRAQHEQILQNFFTLHQQLDAIARTENLKTFVPDTGNELSIKPPTSICALREECLDSCKNLDLSLIESHTLVHGDFERQNLLFQGDDMTGILDFDALCLGNIAQEWAHCTFNNACCDPHANPEDLSLYIEASPINGTKAGIRVQMLSLMMHFCAEDLEGFCWIAQQKEVDLNELVKHYRKALLFAQHSLATP